MDKLHACSFTRNVIPCRKVNFTQAHFTCMVCHMYDSSQGLNARHRSCTCKKLTSSITNFLIDCTKTHVRMLSLNSSCTINTYVAIYN